MSRTGKIIVGLLSLVGVLAYNFTHTGGLLASYVEPRFVGYVAAFGIELAVVGLSLRIDELRRTQGQVAFHVLTLAAVVIVSALANIAEGYAVKFGEPLTSANIGLLDGVQVVVSLAATGLLSLVTFAIAEIVGHDIGASVPQPVTAHVDKPAQPDSNLSESSASGPEKPALLRPTSPKAPRAHAPSRDLTDFDVLKLWRAHGQADAWQQVSDIVSECLNGNTPNLKAWYDGKRSIAGLTTALGMDAAQAKRTGALVRGLIKPSEDQKVIDTDSK